MLPCFRIMAVPMERLQIGVARISVIAIDVIHLDPVVMLEEQSTVPTVTVLRFEQLGESRTDVGMPSLSATPVHPIPIIRAAVACDLDMPGNRHLTMGVRRTASGLVDEVAKARRVPSRCQYRSMAHPMDFVACR